MSVKIEKKTIQELRDGDHAAFEMVFIAYFNKVKHFINGLLRSEDDAEELAQELFVKLWINHDTINLEKSFSTYLYVMARNAAINFLKSKFVRESYANDLSNTEEYVNSEDILYAKETDLLIKMTVSQMPDRRKQIYKLSRNEGLTNDEIASQLNISKKTVENQLSLALKELRNIISLFLMFF